MDDKKKRWITPKRVGITLLLAAAIGLIVSEATGTTHALADLLNPTMSFSEIAYITHEAGTGAQIHATNGGFFLATRDAMRFYNADGAEIFRHPHVMGQPVLFGRGEYAAILEQGGRIFHVFNADGLLYTITTDAAIVRFALGAQGFAAVMMDARAGRHSLEVYNNFGVMFYEGLSASPNILAMLMDISYDGSVLAISYLDINDAEMNSFISLVSIDGSHIGAEDIFAQHRDSPGQIIGYMRFLADGSLVVMTDARLFVLNTAATVVWETMLDNRVTHIKTAESWFAVAYGDAMLNRDGHMPGTVIGRNAFGVELFRYTAPGRMVRVLQAMGSDVLIGCSDGRLAAISGAGQLLWERPLGSSVRGAGIMGNHNSLVEVSAMRTSVLRRVRDNN